MSLTVNRNNIIDIHKGSQKIARVYKGSDLVWGYHPGEVIFESQRTGTHTINIKCNCKVSVIIVGAGGGASSWGGYYSNNYTFNTSGGGGSGAYIHGVLSVNAGTYTATIGAGGNYFRDAGIGVQPGPADDGGNSSVFNQIAGGGKGGVTATTSTGGAGGTATTTITGESGNAGRGMEHVVAWGSYPIQNIAGGASKYGDYGFGGYINDQTMNNAVGGNGYIKIVAV